MHKLDALTGAAAGAALALTFVGWIVGAVTAGELVGLLAACAAAAAIIWRGTK